MRSTEGKVGGRPSAVIACRCLEPELEALEPARFGVETHYLDQGLHRVPDQMPAVIQAKIDEIAERVGTIALGYGLCSNGVVGVRAPAQGLLIPRVHDCVALLLGSHEAYQKAFEARCGTYYLSQGWLEEEKDPLGVLEGDYVPRVGREDAEWALREEMKHYSHIVLIVTSATDLERARARAKENAEYLSLEYEEVEGRPTFFRKLLSGECDDETFVKIPPHQLITQRPFLG